MRAGVLRFIPFFNAKNDNSRIKGTLLSSLTIGGLFSLFSASILILFSKEISNRFFNNPELANILIIMAIALPFSVMFQILIFGFRGFAVVKYQVWAERIFLNLTKLLTVIIFGFLGYGAIGLALSFTVSNILSLIFAGYLFQKKVFPFLSLNMKARTDIKELLLYSLPLLFSGFFGGVIITNIDTAMIGYFRDSIDVGIYNAALPTARITGLVFAPLTVVFLPVITELYSKNEMPELEIIYKTTIKWIFIFLTPLLLILLFYPKTIITFLFGELYSNGSLALVFLSMGLTLRGLGSLHSALLSMIKKTNIIFYVTLAVTIVNIFLNWILIQKIGITGAAMASFLTFSVQYLFYLYLSYHFTGLIPFSYSTLKVILSGLASFLIFFTLTSYFVTISYFSYLIYFLLIGYLGFYTVFLLRSGTLDQDDIEILKKVEKRTGIPKGALTKIIAKIIR
jgi:O-antigen/teichoic acid export membrane protein